MLSKFLVEQSAEITSTPVIEKLSVLSHIIVLIRTQRPVSPEWRCGVVVILHS